MKKKVLALILACGLFVGCQSNPLSSNDSETNGDFTTFEQTPEIKESVEEDSDWKYIQDKGELIIGYTVYAPMNYTDDEGNFTGFDTELSELICEKLGITPNFIEIDWSTKEIELAARTIDTVWNGLTITEERKEQMEITVPYLMNGQVVVMKADAEYTDTSSLIGKVIVAEAGSAGEKAIEEDENLQNAEFIAKEVQTACLLEVAAGTADAAVLDLTLAKAMIGEGSDYSNLVIKDTLNNEYYGIAFRKGSDLCEMVNQILFELNADGTLADLAKKYSLELSDNFTTMTEEQTEELAA